MYHGQPRVSEGVAHREVKAKKFDWSFFDRFNLPPKEAEARRPSIYDFGHVKLDRTVNADKYLLRLKERHRHAEEDERRRNPKSFDESQPSGTVFEEFFVEAMREGNWMNGELFRTSEHDDWWNGVDAVIEWPSPEEGGKPVRMAVDFSTSNSAMGIGKKLETINGMAKLKYFRSPLERNEEGKPAEMRTFFPKVILGADTEIMKAIARKGEMPGHDHPLRTLMLRQAKKQIDVQIRRGANFILNQAWQEEFPNPATDELTRQIRLAKNNDELADVLRAAPEEALHKILNTDTREYLAELLRVKQCLDPVALEAEVTPIVEPWTTLAETSINNRMLGKDLRP